MDRIELDEELGVDETKELKRLDLGLYAPESRFEVKPVSNEDDAKRTALASEINELWGISIPRLKREMKFKGYDFILETFQQVKKNKNSYNPPGLFLKIVSACKVELTDVELK